MDVVKLEVQKRDVAVKANHLRWDGMIPAEFYGAGQENLSLVMDYQAFRKAYQAAGENTIIDLTVGGESASKKVLVQKVQFEPVSGKMMHVDFINVRMDQEVTTNIPLEFVGVAPAVKDLGGMLMTNISELEVKCLPGDLIHSIEVDISVLVDFHTAVHVSDLEVSDKIEVLTDPERTIVTVVAPKEEEEEPAEGGEGAEGEEGAAAEGAEAPAEGGGEKAAEEGGE